MTTLVFRATFDLHVAGATASDRFKGIAEAVADKRGEALTASKTFTDLNRDFTADGITTSHRISILEGGGNLIRDDSIGVVGTTTLTLGGANFDQSEKGLLYAIYLPPSAANIIGDNSLKGLGVVGYEEWLQSVESENSIDLELKLIDLHYDQGLTQQVLVIDDTA